VTSSRSLPYVLAKGFLTLLVGLVGYLVGNLLLRSSMLSDPINVVYLSLVGLLLGYLLSTPLARRWEKFWQTIIASISKIPPQTVLAAGVGVTVALIITVLLNTLLEDVPGFTWYWSLLLTLILSIASAWFFVVNRQLFHVFSLRSAAATETALELSRDKIIDTSAIIDGRIAEVIDANFVDGKLLIPRFILLELQNIADSSDTLRRSRGRRGLEVLDKLIQQKSMPTEVIDVDFSDLDKVDEKLVRLCQQKRTALVTTDYNLNRIAALQNVRVLNVNQLANAIKPVFLPGERLSLYIVKEGREAGQGLAYLEDGTMVVIEDADDLVGKTVEVTVTSHLQTNMGRMIFARPN
jgi:uncharacterized protein YacL